MRRPYSTHNPHVLLGIPRLLDYLGGRGRQHSSSQPWVASGTPAEQNCPELPCPLILDLIQEYEDLLEQKQVLQTEARSAAATVLQAPVSSSEDPIAWMKWLHTLFPDLPRHVLERVVCPAGFNVNRVPYNRHTRRRLFSPQAPTLLHLFSGAQKRTDCGHVLHVKGSGRKPFE